MSRRQKAQDLVVEVVHPRKGERLDEPSPTRRAVVKAAISVPVAAMLFEDRAPLEFPRDPRAGVVHDGD